MRTALVSGGASGVGRACAERLSAEGVRVVTADLAPGWDVRLDVTDPEAVTAAAGRIGPVDILVNSAGIIGPNKPLWEVSGEE
ncbi:SDR family oxidoreductase [Nonomuraea roseola]|uniref:SDR family oxidoreductase n=1 Tax=Nonomuraea roseola TaxID=46179 RepID=A0ABV5PUP3_9ACTN